eukprot:6213012-Pyramimonas_sp.AAC.2
MHFALSHAHGVIVHAKREVNAPWGVKRKRGCRPQRTTSALLGTYVDLGTDFGDRLGGRHAC